MPEGFRSGAALLGSVGLALLAERPPPAALEFVGAAAGRDAGAINFSAIIKRSL